jgi:redox-sensitive bicupin YhaK (pirin superfamily)
MRQVIRPGDLNWMTAGRGITHSERTTDADRAMASRLHGIQAWVALPRAAESTAPAFEHVGADALPLIERNGVELRLIAGEAFGARAPVATASSLFYADAQFTVGASLDLPPELGDRGIYIVAGRIGIDGRDYAAGRMLVLAASRPCRIHAQQQSRLILLGGAPLDGDRAIWWNFVASDPAVIEQAKADWAEGRFPPVPGDDGYMPLPA